MSRRTIATHGPDPIDVTLGLRIRLRRKALGLSQGALAEALGLSFQQVQKYERGSNRVSASMLVRAARFLSCSVAHLVDDQAENTPAAGDVADLMAPGAIEATRAYLAIRASRRPAVLNLLRALAERSDGPDEGAPSLDGEPQAELRVN